MTVSVSVIGASGYAGGELLRLLASHPHVKLAHVVSESYKGEPIREAFPSFIHTSLVFESHSPEVIADSEVIFLAQENGAAMKQARGLLEAGKKVIDLAADFRLKDPRHYEQWYKAPHTAHDLIEKAVYGLPEIKRQKIRGAQLVANPGCYPTASVLALAPLLEAGMVDLGSIIIDAKSGVSGAGRSKHQLEYHFPELNESVRAYAIAGAHRHTPEIEQGLTYCAKSSCKITFTPHLIPITRGILATTYSMLRKPATTTEIHDLYTKRYSDERFVRVYDPGELPSTKSCYGTNQCHIGLAVDERTNRVTVVSAIDNLVKGAAGQAIQNMNLMLGFEETAGLLQPGIWP